MVSLYLDLFSFLVYLTVKSYKNTLLVSNRLGTGVKGVFFFLYVNGES